MLALVAAAPTQGADAPKPVDCSDKAKVAELCRAVEGGCTSICSAAQPDKAADCKKGCEDLRPVCEAMVCPPATGQ